MMLTRPTAKSGKFLKRLLAQSVAPAVLTAAMLAAPAAYAQQTTSSIVGAVSESNGAPASGVRVVITHVPSGTTSVATSNESGRFSAPGLRVGGPYTVRFEPASGKPEVVNDVYLQLGEPFSVSIALKPAIEASVDEIIVSGERAPVKMSSQATFGTAAIEELPTVTRDIKDIIKSDPKILIDPTNSNAIQCVGTSPRFNSLTIDGIQANDDFGLNNNGYPTHHSPIPLDAVDQLAVVLAAFDVDYDGFQGCNINIVTKSGTNSLHGSAYYYYTSDKLSGTRSGNQFNLIKKGQSRTRGGSLGGPIVPDKLFFYGAYDDFQTIAPAGFATSDGNGGSVKVNGVTSADVAQIVSIAQSKYGYNAGNIISGSPEHDRSAIGKLDWDITDFHRASFTYQRQESFQILEGTSAATGPLNNLTGSPRLALSSNFYNFAQTMNNYAVQEFDDWTPEFSTQWELGRKDVSSTRTPLNGYTIGEVRVITPDGGAVVFGPDISSQSNVLSTQTDTFKGKAKYDLGDHAVMGGYEWEKNDYYNLFLQRSLGQWFFSSPTNFQNGTAQRLQYQNAYSGNPQDVAALWNYSVHNLYLQDRWEVTDALSLQAGLRYEVYENPQKPLANGFFSNLYHFSNNENLDGRDLVLPRFGFNYKLFSDTTLHGGAGQFSTLGPAVWMSNDYSNNGLIQRSLTVPGAGLPSSLLNTSTLTLPFSQVANLPNFAPPTTPGFSPGFVNALDPNFKIPSSWRMDFGVDHKFDTGLQLAGEVIYTKVANGILYQDLRLTQTGTAPDGRPIYGIHAGDTRATNAGQDLLLTNTDKGYGLVESIGAQQKFNTFLGDFSLLGGYAHTEAEDVNPGTSSVASSTYNNLAVSDPNHPSLTNSNYVSEHTFTGSITWSKKFFDDAKTSLTLLGTLRSGLPYSFTFSCNTTVAANNPFGDSACNGGTGRELLYVPTGANDPKVNWAASAVTPAQMQAYVARYGLGKYSGQIAPRNAFDAPWWGSLDLHFVQEIPSPIEGHKLSLSVDTTNFSNLLFPQWGRLEQIAFPGNVQVTQARIQNGQYVFATPLTTPAQQISARSSIWQIQMGLRYDF